MRFVDPSKNQGSCFYNEESKATEVVCDDTRFFLSQWHIKNPITTTNLIFPLIFPKLLLN